MDASPKDIAATIPESVEKGCPDYVIGIGASAGGLEALEEFFAFVPPKTGFAFVVVQHLSPDYASKMDLLLARQTSLPVRTAKNGMMLEADHVYLGVARAEMIVSGGRLLLTDRSPDEVFTLPIDHFFRSLADDYGNRAVGVILSGTGSDGTRGAREIRDAGGMVIAQTRESAKFSGMPQSVISAGVADQILPPEQIPRALLAHAELLPTSDAAEVVEESPMERILSVLKKESGIDFNDYKPATVMRRIERRLQMSVGEGMEDYATFLETNLAEVNHLYHDLLIGVTRFFRDEDAYEQLKTQVILPLVQQKAGQPIRLWVAGCATGEEAYSIGILFYEAADQLKVPFSAKIFATDVHGASLSTANLGEYSEEALGSVSDERRARFFAHAGGGTWRVTKELRTAVVFARHNLLTDAPFTRLDLVTCRNMLIYLQPTAQKRILGLFHFALATGGHLFLGSSETPGPLSDEFEPVVDTEKVYRKRRDVRLPVDRRARSSSSPLIRERERGRARLGQGDERRKVDLYAKILEDVMPRSILLDEDFRLQHTFSGAEQFLRVPAGRVTNNALELVDPKLRTALSAALQQAAQRQAQVRYSGLPLETPVGEKMLVQLTVRPYSYGEGTSSSYLVQFETETGSAVLEAALDVQGASTDYVRSLEDELRLAQENLQATIEELETSNEELQATNEELVASNEELQSTNEELHSVNEELYTVNTEHQFQIRELTQVTDDLNHLFQNIDVGVLFLDSDRRIRKFTASMAKILHLEANDVGRPLEHFAQNLHSDLQQDVLSAMERGDVIEREIELLSGPICLLRIAPYWIRGVVRGVVISLVDIGKLKRSIATVKSLSSVVAHSSDAIISLAVDGRIVTWNGGASQMFEISEADAVGKELSVVVPELDAPQWESICKRALAGQNVPSYESTRRHATRGKLSTSEAVSPLIDERGEVGGFGVIIRDITRLKRAEELVLRAVAQRDQFIAVLSHELRNPMMGIQSALDLLKTPGDERAHNVLTRQVRQMTRILEDLLDVTRMRRDKFEMRRTNVALQNVLSDIVASMRSRIEESGVVLQVECPPLPLVAYADASRLQQLLVNLVGNALKYTRAGKRVRVSLVKGDGEARLIVADDGAGIVPDELEAIFEPFTQGSEVPTLGRDSGMGLGLALARAIAQAHGGDITASSPGKGCGSTFVVRIPTVEAPADEPSEVPSKPPSRATVRQRVLLVEDDEDNRLLLLTLLRNRGYEVVGCGDGMAAISLLTNEAFDVAFVDLGLPIKDGFSVARETRQAVTDRTVRMIALTGHGTQKDRSRVQEAGFDEHLVKPVSIETLLRVLEA